MTDGFKAYRSLVWVELKLYLRETVATFFTLGFPVMLVLMFGSIYGNEPAAMFGGYGTVDVSVPSYAVMTAGTAGLMSLVPIIASYRERGILRRLSTTPLRPLTFLLAEVSVLFVMSSIGVLLLVLTSKLVFGLRFRGDVLSVAGGFLLTCLSFYSLGFLLAGMLRTYRTAYAVTMVIFYPMLFMSGAGIPREVLPSWMQKLAMVFPMTHAVTLMKGLWLGKPWGDFGLETVVLTCVLGLCTAVSGKLFRWE